MGFPSTPYFLTLLFRACCDPFLHHIMPMGLLLLSLGSFRPICFSQGQFIYFMERNTLCSSADTLSQFSSSYNTSKICTKETVKKEEMEENEQTLYNVAELTENGQQIIVARGGQSGIGNNPNLCGSESILVLELKIIADVSLVGMPNASKSTLLGAISRAKPAIGHYAFTGQI